MNPQELTREIESFLKTLEGGFDLKVPFEDVSVEAVELGIDEVDDFYLPIEVMGELPETLLYEMMIVDDTDGNE